MNSNKNTNSKVSNLSREDIETYRTTSSERVRHSIEKNALENDFESDALEGWSDRSLQISQMSRLDKRFLKNNTLVYWITGSLVVMIALSIMYVLMQDEEIIAPENNQAKQEIIIEKTDLVLPSVIEEMDELPKKEQIAVKTIVKDFSEQQKNESENPIVYSDVEKLPIKPIENPIPEIKLEKETFIGKEIYLKDLKLLDYRAYRSKPKVVTKQMVLTGTPANLEDSRNSENEFVWKDVDIPYMDYLEKTMELFSKGQNKKALTRFLVILETYPDDLNANFYAGLCYYNLKEYTNAVQTFEKCLQSKFINFNEEAEWYLAKSYLADGKKAEAILLFEKIINSKGYYSSQAKKIVSSL